MTKPLKNKIIENLTDNEIWMVLRKNNKVGEELRAEIRQREMVGGYENLKRLRKAIKKYVKE